eukprot:1161593-Pelagomonas_calceolata.AAC.18
MEAALVQRVGQFQAINIALYFTSSLQKAQQAKCALGADALDANALDSGAFDADALGADALHADALDADALDADAFDADALDADAFEADALEVVAKTGSLGSPLAGLHNQAPCQHYHIFCRRMKSTDTLPCVRTCC